VRTWVTAGETMPRQLCDLWADATGSEAIDGIGATETLSTVISNRPGAVVRGSAGREVSGFECALRDEQDQPVETGQWGTLHVRGATIARGYWGDADTTAKYFKDGWFRTNDVFYQDAAGNYFFVGRANDVFKSGANWISPVRIEQVLQQHPEVLDCAIAPMVEMGGLNRVKAYIVLRNEHADAGRKQALTGELLAFSRERLARYEYPHFIEFISELPRGPNGKLQRNQLRT
jgi:benzoate-CoA ligase